MLAGVNIKYFGLFALLGERLDGTYWPHRASDLHNPLALCIGWSFNPFNQYTIHIFYVNWHCLVISLHVFNFHTLSVMMNTIGDVETCRFNHSLCMKFLVGNCWLNKYLCEGGGWEGLYTA